MIPISELAKQTQPASISVYLKSRQEIQLEIAAVSQEILRQTKTTTAVLRKDWLPISYLSIQENITFGSSLHKKQTREQLKYLLADVELTKTTLQKQTNQLTPLDCIKLQLFHAILMKNTTLIIDDIFEKLSVEEIQAFLPLLQHVTHKYQLAVVLLTQDEKIAQSPYVDRKIA